MEESIFPKPAVADALEDVIELRMHYDHNVEELKDNAHDLQVKLVKSIGAPMYALVDPETEELIAEAGYTSEEGFLEFLSKGSGE